MTPTRQRRSTIKKRSWKLTSRPGAPGVPTTNQTLLTQRVRSGPDYPGIPPRRESIPSEAHCEEGVLQPHFPIPPRSRNGWLPRRRNSPPNQKQRRPPDRAVCWSLPFRVFRVGRPTLGLRGSISPLRISVHASSHTFRRRRSGIRPPCNSRWYSSK
jgi:hypothetical protein